MNGAPVKSCFSIRAVLVILLAPIQCAIADALTTNRIAIPQPRVESGWLRRYADNLDRVSKGNVDLIFVGDSITEWWNAPLWQQYYGSRNAVNMGFKADRICHALWRVMNLPAQKINPKVAVLMIGTGNVPHHEGYTPAQIAEGNAIIVQQLQGKFHGIKVLLLGIFPRMEQDDAVIEKIKKVNAIMSKLVDGQRVYFLDIGDKFIGADGRVSTQIMPDGLHLSAEGYAIWAKSMEPMLTELMGPPPTTQSGEHP